MKYLKFFNETKQVGILYHYTNIENLVSIIRDNRLNGKPAGTVGMGISLTRDKKLHEREPEIESTASRIVLDGDKISQLYKIRPYNDFWDKGTRPYNITWVESEERVLTKYILDIKKYILKVEFSINSEEEWNTDITQDENMQYIYKLLNDNNIEYGFY